VSDVLQQIKARIRPLQASDLISELLGPHREDALRGNLPVVLFCAGSSGRILCPFLIQGGIRPACFCDNDPGRVGQSIDGVPVIAFEELERTHRESLVIIASAAYQHGIRRQLLDAGFHAGNVITLDSPSSEFEAQVRRESLLMLARNGEPGQVMEELEPQAEALQRAYDLLADEKSKALFVQRLALVASGYEYRAYREYLETFSEPLLRFQSGDPRRWSVSSAFFYFTNDVLRMRENEIYVDGGAFTGDTADLFIEACEAAGVRYGHLHCFEPDAGNYGKLRAHTASRRDITCVNRGLWSMATTLRFISSAQTEAYGARIQEEGAIADGVIETASIDEHLAGRPVTLIKMDIEGAEIEALKGAARSIGAHHPQLAISVYHRTRDLFEIPLLVRSLGPNYKLYLRHLGHYFDDVILFATA
jgi:FkbM family methyltransferase